MTDSNVQLIERFYRAFDEGDGDTMASCYSPRARFSDPVFPDLRGDRAGAMWRMLTATPGPLRIELLEHEAGDARGSATGGPTTRSVRPGGRWSTTSTQAFTSRMG